MAEQILALDEEGVVRMLAALGFPFYDAQIKEHGITGEVLVHLDHEALKDVGIHSVGQRLAILKAVYALKVQQNVPVEEGHYIPPFDDLDVLNGGAPSLAPRELMSILGERDDRIRNLEVEVQRLHDSMLALRDDATSRVPVKARPIGRSPTSSLFPHPLSNASMLNAQTDIHRSLSKTRPRGIDTNGPESPRSPRSPLDSPMHQSGEHDDAARHAQFSLQPAGDYGAPFASGSLTPTTPTAPLASSRGVDLGSSFLAGAGSGFPSSAASTSTLPTVSLSASTSSKAGESKERADRQAASASSADNPYRSFRVTLEDPCYKVLPAALKKYKINDDWRQYALFICYGNTERCLSYDEKPLLLFQRLKEGNANPVFMLRHIKDIKSPIAVASAKHAARRDKRAANAGVGLDRPPAMNRDGTSISRPTRLHHPPVLLPVGKDKPEGEEEDVRPLVSPREAPGYCISIYPYLAEREDEFDVAVGDSFVIISKTKGWWVVHRDLGNDDDLTPRKSAWVPAGCLLETNVPPLSLAETSMLSPGLPANASNVPIHPSHIISVSTPGVALMDYVKNGSDELDVKKGVALRILKRYNHWSYAIKEESGERGWIPSWFVNKPSRSDASPTSPTSGIDRKASIPSILAPSTLE